MIFKTTCIEKPRQILTETARKMAVIKGDKIYVKSIIFHGDKGSLYPSYLFIYG